MCIIRIIVIGGCHAVFLVVSTAACAPSETSPVASSDSAASTGAPAGGEGGAASSTSSSGSGGSDETGGAGQGGAGQGGIGQGGGGSCVDVPCTASCPEGYWSEIDGCPACACNPPEAKLIIDGITRDHAFTTLTTTPSFVGGLGWVFDFLWQFDDPVALDEAEDVTSTMRIQQLGPTYEPTDTAATWFYPEDFGLPLDVPGGTYTLYSYGLVMEDLTPVSGWVSIRRVNDMFEGGVWLTNHPADAFGPIVEAHGSFTVPVPN